MLYFVTQWTNGEVTFNISVFSSTHLTLYPGFLGCWSCEKTSLSFPESASSPSGPAPLPLLMSLPACQYGLVTKVDFLPAPPPDIWMAGCAHREPPLPPFLLLPLVASPSQSRLPGPHCCAPPSTQMTWPRVVQIGGNGWKGFNMDGQEDIVTRNLFYLLYFLFWVTGCNHFTFHVLV